MAGIFDAIDSNKRSSIVLLFLSFVLFLGIAWAASYVFGLGFFGFVLISLLGVGYMCIAYFAGDSIVLSMSGAKPVTREQYPFIYNIVEGMAIAQHMPMPKIYIIEDDSPNAFATGRDPEHASVVYTTGILKIMKNEELEGVTAHELSHIGNFDIRFMLFAVVIVGAVTLLSYVASRSFLYSGSGNRRGSGGGFMTIIAIAFLVIAPIFAELVRFAISRQREYLADATAAKITRYPEGLASALEKLSKNTVPLKSANDATAPLYIVTPFAGKVSHLFSTHPPIEDRIKRLRSM